MRGPAVTVTLLLGACGRVAFDPLVGDAPDDGGDSTCWATWRTSAPALTTPELVANINSSDDDNNPSLADGDLTLYLDRGPMGARDVYVATRPDRDSPFGPPIPVNGLSDPAASESRPTVVDDSDLAIVAVVPVGQSSSQVMTARRINFRTFDSLVAVGAPVDGPGNELDVELTDEGRRLFFTRSNSPQRDLHVASRATPTAPFTDVRAVEGLAGTESSDPALSPDGLVMVYADYSSPEQMFVATRAALDTPFETNVSLRATADPGFSANIEISRDGCELFFTSDRAGGLGGFDIYVARVVR